MENNKLLIKVTRTLKSALNVDDQRALEYATIVDKDGRSSIKCGRKSQCDHIKSLVEVNKAQIRCLYSSYFIFFFQDYNGWKYEYNTVRDKSYASIFDRSSIFC